MEVDDMRRDKFDVYQCCFVGIIIGLLIFLFPIPASPVENAGTPAHSEAELQATPSVSVKNAQYYMASGAVTTGSLMNIHLKL